MLKNKNIVFILGSFELGGSERQAFHLARYLMDVEHAQVRFFGFSGPGKLSQICEQYGIPWQIIPNPISGCTLERKIGLLQFIRAMRKNRPDILLPYTMTPNVVCGLTWRWTGAKLCVWNQRDLGIERLAPSLEKKAAKQIPLFLSNSQHGAEFLTRTFKIAPGQLKVIHNGVELNPPMSTRNEWRAKLEVEEETFLACMVANLSRKKDHAVLLQAWCHASEHLFAEGISSVLLLAGRFDDMYMPLKSLVSELGIEKRVQFLGQVDDTRGLLSAVDLGVFSSRSEGSPNGVLECMAAGLAIVATDIPGIREIAGEHGHIQLTPIGDYEKMAKKIIEFGRYPYLRVKAGEQNRKRVQAEFNLTKMCEETVAVLSREINA